MSRLILHRKSIGACDRSAPCLDVRSGPSLRLLCLKGGYGPLKVLVQAKRQMNASAITHWTSATSASLTYGQSVYATCPPTYAGPRPCGAPVAISLELS